MRQIKFRAWDTGKKKMYSSEKMGQDQLTISVDGRGFINVHGTSTKLSTFCRHLIPEQFTGLLDKNGVEIFEGDMVMVDSLYGWVTPRIVSEFGLNIRSMSDDTFEVIGNIHENPELLEKQHAN